MESALNFAVGQNLPRLRKAASAFVASLLSTAAILQLVLQEILNQGLSTNMHGPAPREFRQVAASLLLCSGA